MSGILSFAPHEVSCVLLKSRCHEFISSASISWTLGKNAGCTLTGKTWEPGFVREFWKIQKSQGIVREFCQKSGNFQSKVDIVLSYWDFAFRIRATRIGEATFHLKYHVILTWNFLWNSLGKPGMVREFYSIKWVGTLERKAGTVNY